MAQAEGHAQWLGTAVPSKSWFPMSCCAPPASTKPPFTVSRVLSALMLLLTSPVSVYTRDISVPARFAVIAVGEGQIAESLCLRSQAVFGEIKPFSAGRKEGELGALRAVRCACLRVFVCSYLSAAGVRRRRARLGARSGRLPRPGPRGGGARARSAPWRPRRGGAALPAAVRALPAARRLREGGDIPLPAPSLGGLGKGAAPQGTAERGGGSAAAALGPARSSGGSAGTAGRWRG